MEANATIYPSSITKDQARLLKIAYEEGKKIGYPETIQAILWQETKAGSYGKIDGIIIGDSKSSRKSYGVLQVQLRTAREVLKKYPHLGTFGTDAELLYRLLKDDRFNIRIGAHYFKNLIERFGENPSGWNRAVLAYNVGPSNVLKCGLSFDPNAYLPSVKNHINLFLRPIVNGKKITVK